MVKLERDAMMEYSEGGVLERKSNFFPCLSSEHGQRKKLLLHSKKEVMMKLL